MGAFPAFWISTTDTAVEVSDVIPSRLIPERVVMKLEARRQTNSPRRKKTRHEVSPKKEPEEACEVVSPSLRCVPLTRLPEDLALHIFRVQGCLLAKELLALRVVSETLRALVGNRPSLLFKHALPALAAWRSLVTKRASRTHRKRYNSFTRSPRRNDNNRAVLLF